MGAFHWTIAFPVRIALVGRGATRTALLDPAWRPRNASAQATLILCMGCLLDLILTPSLEHWRFIKHPVSGAVERKCHSRVSDFYCRNSVKPERKTSKAPLLMATPNNDFSLLDFRHMKDMPTRCTKTLRLTIGSENA